MPKMPSPYTPLPNGICTLITISSEPHQSRFGMQEKITCIVEVPEGHQSTQFVYIPHDSYKKVQAAMAAGIVRMDDITNEWYVQDGVRFRVVAQNGKIVSMMPHEIASNPTPAPLPVPAPVSPSLPLTQAARELSRD